MPKVPKKIVKVLKKKLEIESKNSYIDAFDGKGKIKNYYALGKIIELYCTKYLIKEKGNRIELMKSHLNEICKKHWERMFKTIDRNGNIIRKNKNSLQEEYVIHHVTTHKDSLKKLFSEDIEEKEEEKETEEKKESKYQLDKTFHTVAWCLDHECWENLYEDENVEKTLLKLKVFYLKKGGYSSLVEEIDRQLEKCKDDNKEKIPKDGKSKGIESEDNTGEDRIETKFVVSGKYPTLISKPEKESNEVGTDLENENKYQILNIIEESFRLSDYSLTNENDVEEFDLFVINILSKIREDQNKKGDLREKLLCYLSPKGRHIELEQLFDSIVQEEVLGEGTKSEIFLFLKNNTKKKILWYEDILIVNALSISLLRNFDNEKANLLIRFINKAIIENNSNTRKYALVGLILGLFKAYNLDDFKQKEAIDIIASLPEDDDIKRELFIIARYLIYDKYFIKIDLDYLHKKLLIKNYQWFVPFDVHLPFLERKLVVANKKSKSNLFSQIISDPKLSKFVKYELVLKYTSLSEDELKSIYDSFKTKHAIYTNYIVLLVDDLILCVKHLNLIDHGQINKLLEVNSGHENLISTISRKTNNVMLDAYYYKSIMQYEKALKYFKQAIELDPVDYLAVNGLGNTYFELKYYKKALDCYYKALELKPVYSVVINNIGLVFCMTSQYNKAIDFYNKALDIEPLYYKAWYNSGIAHSRLNNLEDAIACNIKALEINPYYDKALNNLGLIYAIKDDYKKAIEYYNEAITLKPNRSQSWLNLAFAYFFLRNYIKANEAIDVALTIDSKDVYALICKGDISLERNEINLALKYYQKAKKIDPDNARSLRQIGRCFQEQGDFKNALEYHLKAKKIDPDNVLNLGLIGRCFQEQGDFKNALEYHLKAKKIDPDNVLNLGLIGRCFQEQGDFKNALEYHLKAKKIDPDNAWNLRQIGWCNFVIGNIESARFYYLKVVKKFRKATYSLMNLGHIELCRKNIKQAFYYYKKSLDEWECNKEFFEGFDDDFQFIKPYGISREEYQKIKEELQQYCQDKQDKNS